MSPVRRHLPPMRVWIGFGADALQEHLQRRHPQLEAQRSIAIVGIEPVIARLQTHARGHKDRFVAGAADLKEDPVLTLHLDFFVIEPARLIHRAKNLEHLLAAELRFLGLPGARWYGFDRGPSSSRRLRLWRGHSLCSE